MTDALSLALAVREVSFDYVNWRGERAVRRATPATLWFGATAWHPKPGWLVRAIDAHRGEMRDFALADMRPVGFVSLPVLLDEIAFVLVGEDGSADLRHAVPLRLAFDPGAKAPAWTLVALDQEWHLERDFPLAWVRPAAEDACR